MQSLQLMNRRTGAEHEIPNLSDHSDDKNSYLRKKDISES